MVREVRPIPLSTLLLRSGIPDKQIIRELGIDRKTLKNWIDGKSVPNEEQRFRLARMLNCSVTSINAAVGRSRKKWLDYQERLSTQTDMHITHTEIIVSIIAGALSSLITTLALLGCL